MDAQKRRQLIQKHQNAIRELESRSVADGEGQSWPPDGYYFLWHVVVGMMLGMTGALVSLGANFVGAPLFGERPLQLIRVYLTFPMGESALSADQGLVLFVGCVLYLITGAFYGIGFHLMMSTYFVDASTGKRLVVATVAGLALWIFNFYLVLSWLQPMLLGGNWIVRLVPLWVGAFTHLAFTWAMLIGETWGAFEAYTREDRVAR